MIKYLKIYSCIAVFAIGMMACSEKFIDLEPNNEVSEPIVYKTKRGITGAVNGIMSELIDNGGWYRYQLTLQSDLMGGNFKYANNASTNRWQPEQFFNFTSSETNYDLWENAYRACMVANKVIAKVDAVPDMTENEKKQAKGQALFLRALSHFDLCKVFAQPYTLNDNSVAKGADGKGGHLGVLISNENLKTDEPSRSTLAECYKQIIDDLLKAEQLMSAGKFDVFRPSSLAAQALLSRVYLYKGDHKNSLIYSNKVIGNSNNRVLLIPDAYIGSWLEEYSPESIFTAHIVKTHLMFTSNGETLFDLLEETGTYGDLSVSNDVYSLIEDKDVRKALYYTDSRDASVIRTRKFPSEESNIPVLRISEIYLNKAEAEYYEAPAEAIKTLNELRVKRGLAALSLSGKELLAAIYKERRIELCGEGHQVFDLVRTKRGLVRDDFIQHARKNIYYPNKLFVLPIPEEELNGNSNCEQNPY